MKLFKVIDEDGFVLRVVRSRDEAKRLAALDKHIKVEVVKCDRRKVKGTYEWAYENVGEAWL
jgi:hypothetical protein